MRKETGSIQEISSLFQVKFRENIGEGKGNPLQYSCLENSMVRGAWWATVHGVAKSRTRLKRLSSSSSRLQENVPAGPQVSALSRLQLFATPWSVAHQAPLTMEFSRPEYWSELPFSSPRDLPDPGIVPGSPSFQAESLLSEPPGKLPYPLLGF